MNKKFLFFGMVAVLGVSLSFLGCESPADGSAGGSGAPGTIILSGDVTAEGIQYALDSVAPVVFAGVVQSDAGFISIPAGKGVTLVGGEAYSVKNAISAQLLLGNSGSINAASTGKIAKGSGTLLIVAPADVLAGTKIASDVPAALKVALQQSGTIDTTGSNIAVQGNITIGGTETSATNITVADLGAKNLYVVGGLTVSAAITGAAKIFVVGNAAVNEAATEKVNWTITGNLTAAKTPTVDGDIAVQGTSTFTENLIAGTLSAGGLATFTGYGSFSSPSLLNGGANFGGNVETSNNSVVTVSGGAAAFTAAGGNKLTGYMSADSVTQSGALTIVNGSLATNGQIGLTNSTSIVLGNGTDKGGGIEFTATGKLISDNFELSGAGSLLSDTTKNAGTTVTFSNTGITRGDGSGTASIVFADQIYLVFKNDALISGINLDVTNGGSIAIAGNGKALKLTGGGSITTSANLVTGSLGAGSLFVVTNAVGSLVAGTNILDEGGSIAAGSYGTLADANFIYKGIPFVTSSGTEAAFGISESLTPGANSGAGAGSVAVFTLNTAE
jgi:hypothetical protein